MKCQNNRRKRTLERSIRTNNWDVDCRDLQDTETRNEKVDCVGGWESFR